MVIALTLVCGYAAAGAAPSFICRPLLDESTSSDAQLISATAINNRKQVLGFGQGTWHGASSRGPMLWGRDRVGHRNLQQAYGLSDLNDEGVIIGNLQDDTGRLHPTMWKDGQQIDLGALPAANGIGIAAAMNNKGVVVGWSQIWKPGQSLPIIKGTLWRHGKVYHLRGLAEKDETSARDINDLGVVVGMNGDGLQPVVWKNGIPSKLPHPAGTSSSIVEAINNQGVSVGYSGHPDGGRATAWQDVVPIDLGRWSGQMHTEASGINDAGEVIGWAWSNYPTEPTPLYWSGLSASPQDLNDLVKGGCTDQFGIPRQLHTVTAINDKGVIIAHSAPRSPPNQPHVAFVLTPR
jgi:uncharacterized membrane protein